MTKLYAENILIGSQWQQDQTINVDDNGVISSIVNGKDANAVVLSGPVVPGMVNCHSHAFQRAFAGFSEYRGNQQDSFWSWRDIMYRFVSKMTPDDAAVVARYAYMEMLKSGFTSVAEFHYLHHQSDGTKYTNKAEMSHQVINAAFETGINITHLPVLYTYAGFGHQAPSQAQARFINQTESFVEIWDQLAATYGNRNGFKLGVAPHSLRAASAEQLNEIIPYVRGQDSRAPVHIHIAEQKQEVADCVKFYKKRPVEWLLDNYEMDSNWCLIHATHLTNDEITRLAGSGAVAGICPITEANLGDGIFPTDEYLAAGGRMAIGSDSHILINVAEEFRLLEYAQRLTKFQRAVLVDENCSSVGQFLYAKSALDGAAAINQNAGCIEVGRRADMLVLDWNEPSMFAKREQQWLDAALFASSQMPIQSVFVAGKIVVEDNQHRLQQKISQDYREVVLKLIE
jgi:formimidoylglutamate deiminase